MYKEIRIIYTESALEEILKTLKTLEINKYFNHPNIQTKWKDNVQHLGTHIWPGTDSLMILIVDNEKAVEVEEAFLKLKKNLKQGVDMYIVISPIEKIL